MWSGFPPRHREGVQVRLEMVSAKRHTTAWVREVVSLTDDPESWLIGLELEVPGNFWGIDYAPTDWKMTIGRLRGHCPAWSRGWSNRRHQRWLARAAGR